MSKIVRVSDEAYKNLAEFSKEDDKTMALVLEELLLAEKKRRFFLSINKGYDQLKKNPNEWKKELNQRQSFEKTLIDSISKDEYWTMDGGFNNDKAK